MLHTYRDLCISLCHKMANLLRQGFAHIFVGTFLQKGVAMIASVVVARLVDKDDYAYLAYSDTLYGYIVLCSGFGLSSALIKTCASCMVNNKDKAYLDYALTWGTFSQTILSALLVSICFLIVLPFPEAKLYIIASLLYPPINTAYEIMVCYLRAKQKHKLYANLNVLYATVLCVLSTLLVFFWSAIGVVAARYAVLVVLSGVVIYKLKKILCSSIHIPLTIAEKKSFWAIALAIMAANLFSGMMPINENMLVSTIIADETITANFKVAGIFPQLLILVTQAVVIYFNPIVSEMDNNHTECSVIRRYAVKIGVLNFCIVIVALIVGVLLTPWLINILYGEKYMDSVSISYLLWCMCAANAAIRMVPMNILFAVRRYKFNLYMSVIAVLIQLTLDWYFIKSFGMMGVAYGAFSVYLITGVLYWNYLIKILK